MCTQRTDNTKLALLSVKISSINSYCNLCLVTQTTKYVAEIITAPWRKNE